MKTLRAIFYLVAILTLCEVMELRSLCQQNSVICFDWMETPLEEDEAKEYDDEDEFFFQPQTSLSCRSVSTPAVPSSLHFDLSEPFQAIIVPPPQG